MGTKHGEGKKIVCVQCGKLFTAQGSRTTCSFECRDGLKKKRFPHVDPHSCEYVKCENIIQAGPVRKDRKFCSITCSKLSRKSSSNIFNFNTDYLRVAGPIVNDHSIFSTSGPWVRLHVIVAYDKYGPGPHQCYWCQRKIDWYFGNSHNSWISGEYKVVVDHLNTVKIDNRSENLVLSCNPCNLRRSRDHMPL